MRLEIICLISTSQIEVKLELTCLISTAHIKVKLELSKVDVKLELR